MYRRQFHKRGGAERSQTMCPWLPLNGTDTLSLSGKHPPPPLAKSLEECDWESALFKFHLGQGKDHIKGIRISIEINTCLCWEYTYIQLLNLPLLFECLCLCLWCRCLCLCLWGLRQSRCLCLCFFSPSNRRSFSLRLFFFSRRRSLSIIAWIKCSIT